MKAMRNVAVVAAISILTCSGVALAQGGNGKAFKTQARNGAGTSTQSAGTTAIRPEGSQRRDGTFLTTGVTANGSTTRPSKGNGLQDGSRLTTTVTTDTAPQ